MKKLFLTMLGVSAMLCSTSCSDEEIVASGEGEAMVQFTVELDGADASRADAYKISDGTTVDKVYYEVYTNVNGEQVRRDELKGVETITGKKATVQLALVKGQAYDIVFWASKEGVYDTSDLKEIKVKDQNTINVGLANDETKDAFTAVYRTAKVTGPIKETIELTRPFAQINFGTLLTDMTNAEKAGALLDKSMIEVTNLAHTYNALSEEGVVPDGEEAKTVTFGLNAIPNRDSQELTFGEGVTPTYEYLATAYVLFPGKATDQVTTDLTMTVPTDLNQDVVLTVPNAPAQRNYRTNILGNLLTNTADFEVVVDPIYVDDKEAGYYVANGKTYVSSAEGLKNLAELVAKGEMTDANIVLTGDIDLAAATSRATSNFSPIGSSENPFTGTFDGQGYTIKNLNIVETEAKEGKAYIGFFGYADNVTIKNVVFENVNINIACLDIDHSQGHIGAVAGSLEGTSTIENVTVKGDVKVEATTTANGASRVAVVAGGNVGGNVTMKNVHVIANEGSYLKANNNVGALAGQLQVKNVFENCSSNIDVTGTKFFAGGLIGLAAGDSQFTNCHTTGDVTITAGRAGRANDHYRVGGIAGGWADGKTKVCTLSGCSYTGKVSGTNADGSVAEPLDYMGYVGRGYTLTNCEGSKVVIDGVSFVQKGNAAPFGIYDVTNADGESVVTVDSKTEVQEALENGENVLLTNDIAVAKSEVGSNGYGATGISQLNGGIIDGNGNDISVNAWGTWDSAINTTGGTIKNVNVTGGMRGIFVNHNSSYSDKVILDNVTIDGTVYTISCDQGTGKGLEATNCTINGWTSYAATIGNVVFTNCSFGEGQGYKYCRPYAPTTFTNCDFAEGFVIDALAAVVLENCTLNGVAITAENVATLVTSNVGNATVR